MTDENKYELLRKKLQNEELSEEETSEWDDYIKRPKQKKEFDKLKVKWKLSEKVRIRIPLNTEASWKKFNSDKTIVKTLNWYQKRTFKIAASLLFLITFAVLFYLFQPSSLEIISTGMDENREYSLPDGTKVWLNENSSISYSKEHYGSDTRSITMDGEVYYNVERNESIPFEVAINEVRVKVLGTSFNIKSGSSSIPLEVLVTSGKVSLSSEARTKEQLILTKGQSGIFNWENQSLEKSDQFNLNEISWQTRELVFKEDILEDVLADLEKHFGITIKVQNPDILNCRFTSSFRNPKLSEVMEAITVSLDLKSGKINNKSYSLTGKGC
ncbi:MAG: FecR domain-containing protein [Bacteroidota bacterium]